LAQLFLKCRYDILDSLIYQRESLNKSYTFHTSRPKERGRIFWEEGLSPLLNTPFETMGEGYNSPPIKQEIGAKPIRVGGWETRHRLKTGGINNP